MRYTKRITKISLCCGILSSLIWQDTIERAVGHYTVSRDLDVTDQECGLSFPDHLPCPRQDGGRKWAGDETKPSAASAMFAEVGAGYETMVRRAVPSHDGLLCVPLSVQEGMHNDCSLYYIKLLIVVHL